MGKTEFVIPKVIRDAVHNALASYPVAANTGHAAEIACEAFARALIEHPIVPTLDDAGHMYRSFVPTPGSHDPRHEFIHMAVEWQRRMFDAPEPEVPEDIKDMLLDARAPDHEHCFFKPSVYNERILEAFRRGRESK